MNDMKKTKEGVNLKKKKFLRLKNTGSILVLMGLLIIFVIALYTFILHYDLLAGRCRAADYLGADRNARPA